eukprot:gene32840-40537_t
MLVEPVANAHAALNGWRCVRKVPNQYVRLVRRYRADACRSQDFAEFLESYRLMRPNERPEPLWVAVDLCPSGSSA